MCAVCVCVWMEKSGASDREREIPLGYAVRTDFWLPPFSLSYFSLVLRYQPLLVVYPDPSSERSFYLFFLLEHNTTQCVQYRRAYFLFAWWSQYRSGETVHIIKCRYEGVRFYSIGRRRRRRLCFASIRDLFYVFYTSIDCYDYSNWNESFQRIAEYT